MPEFLPEELNLIYLYDPGNLHGLIYELRSMMAVLMPDENELRNLAQGVITKLNFVFLQVCKVHFVNCAFSGVILRLSFSCPGK